MRRRVPALTHDPSPPVQPPEVVGPFRVRRVLASGTLGPRLLVEDDRGRLQVLKLITDVADDAGALAALLERVRQSLPSHPALLPITEVGASDEGVYLASPVLNAPSVEGRLRGGRQTLDATLQWLRAVSAGLHAAHEAGIHHGAIHPRDVLVTDEGGVLTGAGIAPMLEHLKLQAPVRVPFTAPERASGRAWDARADQYSLAMLALDALSGRRLIAGTIPAFDRWTLAETPTEDARLHEVFVRALHPEPEQRYPSLVAWCAALAGPEREGESGALSRFAREGVILASPATATEASREIKVQAVEDPDGVALSLFPQEDGTVESPVVAAAASEQAVPLVPEAEQEWLVADVPEEGSVAAQEADPLVIRYAPTAVAVASADMPPAAVPAASAEWRLDDHDEPVPPETARTWESAGDESVNRRPWLLAVVMLVMAALAYGTWSSLERPGTGPNGQRANGREPDAPSSADATTESLPPASPGAPALSPRTTAPTTVPQGPVTALPQAAEPSTVPPAGRPEGPPVDAPLTGLGRVLIRSSPVGEVSVNGVARGETPVVLRDLPFGAYAITVTRAGFAPVAREVTLLTSQPVASLSIDLVRQGSSAAAPSADPRPPAAAPVTAAPPPPPGTAPAPAAVPTAAREPAETGGIFVMSTPARALLFVDGQAYGSTPAAIPGLSQGAHVVRVEAPGFRPWEGRVAVIAGTRVRVQATLQQEQE